MTFRIPYGHGIRWNAFAPSCLVICCPLGWENSGGSTAAPCFPWIFQGPCTDLALSLFARFLLRPVWELFTSLLLLFPTCYFRSAPFLKPYCLPGKVWGNPIIKPSRRPWALGVCLLPAFSCWSRATCPAPTGFWSLYPFTGFLLLPYSDLCSSQMGDLLGLSKHSHTVPRPACRDTRSLPTPDLLPPPRTSVIPLCPSLTLKVACPLFSMCVIHFNSTTSTISHTPSGRRGHGVLYCSIRLNVSYIWALASASVKNRECYCLQGLWEWKYV